jgi:hypothetical protein
MMRIYFFVHRCSIVSEHKLRQKLLGIYTSNQENCLLKKKNSQSNISNLYKDDIIALIYDPIKQKSFR